jgi:hypothetical protein
LFSKCVSPPMSISRSSSTVTSPITTTTPIGIAARPIPKSERPWRQKLADAQRLRFKQFNNDNARHSFYKNWINFREAQAERSFGNHHHHHHVPLESYESTARILAARSARRASVEQQQTQKQQNSEQQLEKEIAALKCYVSEPGALDKVDAIPYYLCWWHAIDWLAERDGGQIPAADGGGSRHAGIGLLLAFLLLGGIDDRRRRCPIHHGVSVDERLGVVGPHAVTEPQVHRGGDTRPVARGGQGKEVRVFLNWLIW